MQMSSPMGRERCAPTAAPRLRMTTVARALALAAALAVGVAPGARAADGECEMTGGAGVEPRGVLTPRAAAAAALLGNPRLAAHSCELRARDARILQAGLPANPDLRVEVENVAGSGVRAGDEQAETTLLVSQLFELGGKRARRRRVAELERELAEWDYEEARVVVLADTAKAFVRALGAEARLALAVELEAAADETARGVGARVDAGAAAPSDLGRARVARGRAAAERRRLAYERAGAFAHLAALWGGAEPAFTGVEGPWAEPGPPPARENLLARVGRSPELARWETERAERRAVLGLEKAGRVPDVALGAGGRYFSDNGDGALVFELSLPLPLLDRNQGAIAAARARLAKVDAERAAAERAVRAAVTAAHARLAAAHEEVALLRAEVLPAARAALAEARRGFGEGALGFMDLIDAQRALFAVRADEIRALERLHLAAVEIDRLTGAGAEDGR